MILHSSLSDNSRVWVFQSKKEFTTELSDINMVLSEFITNWTSHGEKVNGEFHLVMNHFIVVAAEELKAPVSGCSIDSLVGAISAVNQKTGLDLFDRQTIFFMNESQLEACHMNKLDELIREGQIDDKTLMINTLVKNIGEVKIKWLSPLKLSWHRKLTI